VSPMDPMNSGAPKGVSVGETAITSSSVAAVVAVVVVVVDTVWSDISILVVMSWCGSVGRVCVMCDTNTTTKQWLKYSAKMAVNAILVNSLYASVVHDLHCVRTVCVNKSWVHVMNEAMLVWSMSCICCVNTVLVEK